LGIRTNADPPVKVVDHLVQQELTSKKSIPVVLNIFKVLIFYDVMLCVLIETGVCLCFIYWTNLEVLLVSTQEFPDD
jgi:hypothetical protein